MSSIVGRADNLTADPINFKYPFFNIIIFLIWVKGGSIVEKKKNYFFFLIYC